MDTDELISDLRTHRESENKELVEKAEKSNRLVSYAMEAAQKSAELAVDLLGLIHKMTQTDLVDLSQKVVAECMQMFEEAGYGKPGSANTLWAMTKAACEEVIALRKETKVAMTQEEAELIDREFYLSCGDQGLRKDYIKAKDVMRRLICDVANKNYKE